MNGVEKISARIKADAEARIAEITAQADKKCAEIAEEYNIQSQSETESIKAEAEREAAALTERAKSAAGLEKRRRLLEEKQRLVEEAFALAEKRIADKPTGELTEFYAAVVAKAAQSGDEELIFSPDDRAEIGEAVTQRANERLTSLGRNAALRLSDEMRPIRGVILKRGLIEVNCELGVLVDEAKRELSGDVASALFG